jgi:hypothetical protein
MVLLSGQRVQDALLGVQLPARLREPFVPLLHADAHSVHVVPLVDDPVPMHSLMPVVALVSLSVIVGLSTAASP